jgi:hypothetical protein
MKIYTRKNALVGYLVLESKKRALQKKVRRRRRSGLKVAAYIGLGLISAGVLAGVLAIALRHRSGDVADSALESDAEIVGEYVTTPEPAPAT